MPCSRQRNTFAIVKFTRPVAETFYFSAQIQGQLDLSASPRLPVVDGPFADGHVQHFFQAERLGAKLDFVGAVVTFAAMFVLDGIR